MKVMMMIIGILYSFLALAETNIEWRFDPRLVIETKSFSDNLNQALLHPNVLERNIQKSGV